MSVAIAFVISAGAAYLIEYLDDTFKTPEDVTRGLKLPVLGYVTRLEKEEEGGFIVTKDPDSPISEAFRSMSLNLEFIDVDKQQKTVLISSVGPEEGKTFIAANLAMTMAQIGRKVILLEGDLRRPSVHQVLNEPNVNGLSEVIRGECSIEDVAYSLENGLLKVITAGGEVPNPSNALGSKKMDGILYYLRSQADIIIIDGPPMLVSDSKVLANKVDLMLLVVRYAKTRKGIAQEALEQMDQVGTKIAGVVMNDLPKDQGHYGVYRYYSRKEGSEKPPATASKNGLKIPWLKGAFETLSAKIEQGGKNLRAK
jgi:capsular exopolysaccharide synthesis family protein